MAVDSSRSQIWPTPTNLWGPKPNLLSFNCTVTLVTKVFPHLWQNVYNIVYSQAVTHPSTNTTRCCLTSVIGRELVLSTWYGRRHWLKWKIDHVLKNIQVEPSQTVWGGFLLYRNTLHKSHLVATLYNTSYTPKYKCGGSWFQSPKYWQSCQKCVVFIK